MDHGIGQVLECLKATGLESNTVVIFTSDNGGQINVGANNGLLRDGSKVCTRVAYEFLQLFDGQIGLSPEALRNNALTMDPIPLSAR